MIVEFLLDLAHSKIALTAILIPTIRKPLHPSSHLRDIMCSTETLAEEDASGHGV